LRLSDFPFATIPAPEAKLFLAVSGAENQVEGRVSLLLKKVEQAMRKESDKGVTADSQGTTVLSPSGSFKKFRNLNPGVRMLGERVQLAGCIRDRMASGANFVW